VSRKSARLPIDPNTNLPSIQTFGALSHFLRSAVADEDTRIFSEGMGELAERVEAIVQRLREDRSRDAVAPMLMDLMTVLRDHRAMVVGLGLAWRGLYEYPAYLQALNNLRVLIGQWLLQGGAARARAADVAGGFRALVCATSSRKPARPTTNASRTSPCCPLPNT
jgi:hypothetical protein